MTKPFDALLIAICLEYVFRTNKGTHVWHGETRAHWIRRQKSRWGARPAYC